MKQAFRIIVLSLLATLYCATVVVAIETSLHFGHSNPTALSNDHGVITTHTIDYACFLTRPQNLVVPALRVDSLQDKKVFSEYLVTKQWIQKQITCKYQQYVLVSKSFLVNYRKTDGIFPFHYFW